MPVLVFSLQCRSTGAYCDKSWSSFYPTDLEFQEEPSTATLRIGACYENSVTSTRFQINDLDGVDLNSDLVLPIPCGQEDAFPRFPEPGRSSLRMLNLSNGENVPITVRHVTTSQGCGFVVRPRIPLKYSTFYSLYLMRTRSTERAFQEPRAFRKLKWKAFRNNIDTEADELYRDAIQAARDRWGSHPESFLLIMAFTTRSYRSVALPSIAVRNEYLARANKKPTLIPDLSNAHLLSQFMMEMHPLLQSSALQKELQSLKKSKPQDSETIGDPTVPSAASLEMQNLKLLSETLNLQSAFAEIPGSCITRTDPTQCDFVEVDLPVTNLRYVPLLHSPGIQKAKKVLVIPLQSLNHGMDLADLLQYRQEMEKQGIGMVLLAGPIPDRNSNHPDHIQASLLHSSFSLESTIRPDQEARLYCLESTYCPMLALYSRRISGLILPGSTSIWRGRTEDSFPAEEYRRKQNRLAAFRSFQFESYLPEWEKSLRALRKDRLEIVRTRNPEDWFQKE